MYEEGYCIIDKTNIKETEEMERKKQVIFNLTNNELTELYEEAKKLQLGRSDFIRMCINKFVGREMLHLSMTPMKMKEDEENDN